MSNIIKTIEQLDAGNLVDEAGTKLADLVKAVQATGKPGKLSITISVRKATADAMAITGKTTLTKPSVPAAESLMFANEEGELSVEHPRQNKLDLKAVEEANTPLKALTESVQPLKLAVNGQ